MKANPEPEKMSDAGCTMSEEKKGRKTGDRRPKRCKKQNYRRT